MIDQQFPYANLVQQKQGIKDTFAVAPVLSQTRKGSLLGHVNPNKRRNSLYNSSFERMVSQKVFSSQTAASLEGGSCNTPSAPKEKVKIKIKFTKNGQPVSPRQLTPTTVLRIQHQLELTRQKANADPTKQRVITVKVNSVKNLSEPVQASILNKEVPRPASKTKLPPFFSH